MLLLDLSSDITGNLVGIIILAIIVIVIQAAIIRWIFRIGTQINNQKTMISLLIKLCEKSGVTKDEVEIITKIYNFKEP
jgi:hypothetical protein